MNCSLPKVLLVACNTSPFFLTDTLYLGKYWSVFCHCYKFTFLRILYKWKHTVSTLFAWFLSSRLLIFRLIYVVVSVRGSLFFIAELAFHCNNTSKFFIQLPAFGHLGCLPNVGYYK